MLVRNGWKFLANDHPFLYQHGDITQSVFYPGPIMVTPTTIALFPELESWFSQRKKARPRYKESFYIEDMYPDCVVKSAPTQLLLFPGVEKIDATYLEELSSHQVLLKLISSSLERWDKEILEANFALLGRVAETTPAYQLHVGADFHKIPTMIKALLN